LITFFAIAGIAFASGGQMYSPGPLNADQGPVLGSISSHADIAGDCETCHTAPWETETMDDRCVVCHTNISAELADRTSVHGKLKVLDQTAACRECHPEHNGEHASLTVLEEWKFPHQVTGYLLDGHKAKENGDAFLCRDCHGDDVTTFDSSTCEGCHDAIKLTFMVDHMVGFGKSCLNCHDGKDTFGDDFTHNKFTFSLIGGHALAFCSQCHMGARSVVDLQTAPQNCFACHENDDPHEGQLGTDCASCHTPEDWNLVQYDHNKADFKLVGSHTEVACKDCHADNLFAGTPKDCFSCHQQDDQHDGRFGEDCASCHNPSSWEDWTFDHKLADFQLTGKHTEVKCGNCHTSGYRGTPKECFSCHQNDDQHNGQFGTNCARCHVTSAWSDVNFDHSETGFVLTGRHFNVACTACHVNGVYKGTATICYACHKADDHHNGQFGTECSTCHNTSGWANVSFDHATTGFPLTGSHKAVNCLSCHVNGKFKGTPTNCFACHASDDHHNGQFGTDCAACHNTSGWGNATFDHSSTGFPLTGQHNNVNCQACHTTGVFKGAPMNCYACHASDDHHNGQFGTDCAACHTTSGWGNVTFNHANTNFPLTGRHTTVNCQSCHTNGVYKGTPTNCYACHASDDHHNGQFGTSCGSCHTTNSWGGATFDHSNTGFPLVGKHSNLACSNCHSNGVYQGTPTNCYACHASNDHHNGQFGTNCGSCHTPSGWGNVNFDHNNTAFPLVGKHTGVSCNGCHSNGVYQGTPTECYACHAQDDAHNGRNGTNCGECHTPRRWGD